MRHFLTADGIIDITVGNDELFSIISGTTYHIPTLESYRRSFSKIVESEGILFKHPDCTIAEANNLLGNHIKRDATIYNTLELAKEIQADSKRMLLITRLVFLNPPSFYIMTPLNSRSIDTLYRKKLLDEILKTL